MTLQDFLTSGEYHNENERRINGVNTEVRNRIKSSKVESKVYQRQKFEYRPSQSFRLGR